MRKISWWLSSDLWLKETLKAPNFVLLMLVKRRRMKAPRSSFHLSSLLHQHLLTVAIRSLPFFRIIFRLIISLSPFRSLQHSRFYFNLFSPFSFFYHFFTFSFLLLFTPPHQLLNPGRTPPFPLCLKFHLPFPTKQPERCCL